MINFGPTSSPLLYCTADRLLQYLYTRLSHALVTCSDIGGFTVIYVNGVGRTSHPCRVRLLV